MTKRLFISIIYILLCAVSTSICFAQENPAPYGKFESDIRIINNWRVLIIREGNIKYVSIETLLEPMTLLRISILKNNNTQFTIISPSTSPNTAGVRTSIQAYIIIANKRYDFPLDIEDRGGWLFGLLNGVPKNLLNMMSKNNTLVFDAFNKPITLNLSGFNEVLKYANYLKSKL